MSEICVVRYEAFGTAGNASRIRSLDLEEMVKRYDSGELDPTVHYASFLHLPNNRCVVS